MNNTEMKKIIIDQQELIVLLRNKLARLRYHLGEALDEIEFDKNWDHYSGLPSPSSYE